LRFINLGCDYFKLDGIGPKKALFYVKQNKESDLENKIYFILNEINKKYPFDIQAKFKDLVKAYIIFDLGYIYKLENGTTLNSFSNLLERNKDIENLIVNNNLNLDFLIN
jgi:hypothetical protein